MDAAAAGLPPAAADTAHDSLGGALAVAAHGGGAKLVTTAQQAFVSGMHTAVIVAAAIALAGALIAPPTPMSARMAMSISGEVASAESPEPRPNTARPNASAFCGRAGCRPRPRAVSSTPAKTRV